MSDEMFVALELTEFGTASVGSLVKALEGIPGSDRFGCVEFDFGSLRPTRYAHSYRGHYDHLAVGFSEGEPPMLPGEWAEALRDAVRTPHTGYKGGEYRMTMESPIWVARAGVATGTAIVSVRALLYDNELYVCIVDTKWMMS